MTIKIQGTDVIGSLHDLRNITNTLGLYTTVDRGTFVATTSPSSGAGTNIGTNLAGNAGSGSWSVLDYMSSTELGGITNWRFSETAEPGFTLAMFVDASSSGHDQTFNWLNTNGTIHYPADTEPDWTLARYWMHQITVWNSNEISIVSTSWAS
jgi:hypothetical protein